MPLGPLLLGVVAGGLFVGHGAQKLSGFFGVRGLNRTGAFFESLRARFPGGCRRLGPVSASWPAERCSCSGLVTLSHRRNGDRGRDVFIG